MQTTLSQSHVEVLVPRLELSNVFLMDTTDEDEEGDMISDMDIQKVIFYAPQFSLVLIILSSNKKAWEKLPSSFVGED